MEINNTLAEPIMLEQTTGYALADAFRPFIDHRMSTTDAEATVKDMAKAINSSFMRDKSARILALKEIVETTVKFMQGERVQLAGLTYQKGVNENSFTKEIKRLTLKING